MQTSQAVSAPLIDVVWRAPAGERARWLRWTMLALVGTAVLTLSAKTQVPFWPVPMTLQTLAIVMIGAAFGRVLGTATLLLYILEGAVGLPVFAGTPEKGIGLAYLAGPTGGYIAGFVLAAMVAGWAADKGWSNSFLRMTAVFVVAHALVFVPGVLWLSTLMGGDLGAAIAAGATPFIAGLFAKSALGGAAIALGARWLPTLKG